MTTRDLGTETLKCVNTKKNAKNSTILFLGDRQIYANFRF